MFQEWEFLDRVKAAADAGFRAVECQFPYESDPDSLATVLSAANIPMVLINTPGGGVETGSVGLAAIPGQERACHAGIELALTYCRAVGCDQVHLMAGIVAGKSHDDCRKTFVANACHAADVFAPHGVRVLLEPINTIDKPGYFLARNAEAVSVLTEIRRANAGLQFDFYHAVRMGEEPAECLSKYAPWISHVQISGCPGRHEPDVGEIDYPLLFEAMDKMKYAGWVGCEYTPASSTLQGLGWARDYDIMTRNSD